MDLIGKSFDYYLFYLGRSEKYLTKHSYCYFYI